MTADACRYRGGTASAATPKSWTYVDQAGDWGRLRDPVEARREANQWCAPEFHYAGGTLCSLGIALVHHGAPRRKRGRNRWSNSTKDAPSRSSSQARPPASTISPGGWWQSTSGGSSRGQPAIAVENKPREGGHGLLNDFARTRAARRLDHCNRSARRPAARNPGGPGAKFDPQAFTWLGSLSSFADDAYMLIVNATPSGEDVDDLRKPGISATIGADVPGSTNLTFALIPKNAFGLNLAIKEAISARPRCRRRSATNEIDGQVIRLVSISANQAAMWTSKSVPAADPVRPQHPASAMADVPTGRELTKDPKVLALLEFAELPFFMALPFLAPPGLPQDRAAALRAAFMAMCKDQGFLDDAKRAKLDISPIDGEAIRALLAKAAATPKDV